MKHVLTIAGHDLSSGAGITKDLEIFFALNLHPLSIPAGFVIQGPRGVSDVIPTPRKAFSAMLNTTAHDVRLDGIKIGALGAATHVRMVASFLEKHRAIPLVVDPVLASKNGRTLLSDDGLKVLTGLIFPRAYLITPNIDEASRILKRKIRTVKEMEQASLMLSKLGPKHVLLKGGHLPGEPIDILFDGKEAVVYTKVRLERHVHGTGCALSSLMLSFIVLGYPIREAFLEAEKTMEELLQESYRIDSSEHGYWYTALTRIASRGHERWQVIKALNAASARLQALNMVELIPEVQMNMGYAIRGAGGTEDVAAFPGRIGQSHGKLWFKGTPEFGASSHVARLILTYVHYHPHIRACVNLRYDDTFIERARLSGLDVRQADRRREPENSKGVEGRSFDFLVDNTLKGADRPPDIIYDTGDMGKEPIIRLFARDPAELLTKMEMIRSWKTN
jgi:hydroxymethylpyrimidine kinase/phosphomethylpyrimidine kinase